MRALSLSRVLFACFLIFASTNVRADQEEELITILQSGAGVIEKCAACQQLAIVGTSRAVPALSGLLNDERITHAARNALETIPGAAAGKALRDALGQAPEVIKAGLINSLAKRGESESLPLFKQLLDDGSLTVATSAAAALGTIGGQEALSALSAARAQARPEVKTVVLQALLQCAEHFQADNASRNAIAIYRSLLEADSPPQIQTAAWRGLVLSDASQRVDLVTSALRGQDRLTHLAALLLLRELGDANLVNACLEQWANLPPDSQVAVLESSVKLGTKPLPTVRSAAASEHVNVRIAAWQALAELEDPSMLSAVAKAAARGEPAERDAARDTLARLRGPGVDKAILTQIAETEPPVKAELLRALGNRGDAAAADVLLGYADNAAEPVRLAALESLGKLAVPRALTPLLNIAGKLESERERDPLIKTLSAICQVAADKDQSTRSVLEALNRLPSANRRHLMQLLSELATPAALQAAQDAAQNSDPALAREGVRVLTQWPNAAAAQPLLALARSAADPTLQTLALSGSISVAEQEADLAKRFDLLQQSMAVAKRSAEKKQVLGQISQIPTPAALQIALDQLADSDLATEAGLAAVTIAEKLAGAQPQLAEDAAVKVLAHCKNQDIVKRASALRR